jgi:hypothetical protein
MAALRCGGLRRQREAVAKDEAQVELFSQGLSRQTEVEVIAYPHPLHLVGRRVDPEIVDTIAQRIALRFEPQMPTCGAAVCALQASTTARTAAARPPLTAP